ncbi:secA translation cis-regulator SecM [Histophilus somni]
MILIKGKQYFWSQLLLSVIAFFTLPVAQDIAPQKITNDYPKTQNVIQQLYYTASNIQQVQQQQLRQIRHVVTESSIPFQFVPLFLVGQFSHLPLFVRSVKKLNLFQCQILLGEFVYSIIKEKYYVKNYCYKNLWQS